jgi:hypothetical protein
MSGDLTLYLMIQVPQAMNLVDLNFSNMMAGMAQRKPTKKRNNIWWGSWTGNDHDRRLRLQSFQSNQTLCSNYFMGFFYFFERIHTLS